MGKTFFVLQTHGFFVLSFLTGKKSLFYIVSYIGDNGNPRMTSSDGHVDSLVGFWLVGLGLNGPLRQYFSLYRAVSQREGERGKKDK